MILRSQSMAGGLTGAVSVPAARPVATMLSKRGNPFDEKTPGIL